MNFLKHILLFIALIVFTITTNAQTGTIAGKVVDAEFGDGMVGANVMVENTSFGAAADIDGNYLISNLAPGKYDLVFSVIGFEKKKVTGIVVSDGKVTKVDVVLAVESITTDEVVISATLLLDNEAGLLIKRQKSAAVSDAISAEEISKSGSGDAAAAMKKVTGASVVGGKYVYVRGLGDRYSATMLNGSEVPSADPDRKSFQLDLIPSNMLDNINTVKTFTPDKPGSFTGGLVDVSLRSYPEKLSVNFKSSVGYNTIATGNDNFILGNSGDNDWLGFDDGTRSIPGALDADNVSIPRTSSVSSKEEALALNNYSTAFNNVMSPSSATATPNGSFALSIGNTLQLDEKNESSLGYFGSVTWGTKSNFVENGEVGRYKLIGDLKEVSSLEAEFKGNDIKGSRTVDWGLITNLAYKNASLGEVKFSYMRTQSAESIGRYLSGYRDRDRSSASSTVSYETRVISWTERALDNFQLDGNHALSKSNNSKLNWKVSYAVNTQDEPDQRYFFNIYKILNDGSKYYSFDAANSQPISRYFRDLKETNFSTQADFTTRFNFWSKNNAQLKTGFYYSDVNRDYNQRRYDYEENSVKLADYNDDLSAVFNNVGIVDSTTYPTRYNKWFGLTIDNQATRDSTNYFRGESNIAAGYAMLDLSLTDDLRFIGGARLETTKIDSWTLDKDDEEGQLDNTDVLPSINFIYAFTDNMNLRATYSNTIARPTFRELAPYISFEFVGDFLYIGNANLKRTLIHNYDLRWEWFVNPGEIVAISGFYKDFVDPIESYIDPTFSDDNTLRSVKNVEAGRVYGVEMEFRKGLGFISSALDNFKIGTNLSLIHSEVDIPEEELREKNANGDIDPDKTRPFPGQSPYLFNLNFTYDNYHSDTYAGIYYTLFGDRLFVTGRHATPDVYERGYGSLDVKVTQGLGEYFELSIAGKNLLNPTRIFSYMLENDNITKEYMYSAYKAGSEYSISISYKL